MDEKSKDKFKLTLIVVLGIIILIFGYYFINPIIKIFSGIHVSFNEIANKYFISDDSQELVIFNDELAYFQVLDSGVTFTFTYEEGFIKSSKYNFLVLKADELWFIEGGCYFYEYTF